MKILFITLISLLSLLSPVRADEVEVLTDYDKTSLPILNEQLRVTARRLRDIEDGVSLTTGVAGVLPLANGGTGEALVDPGADRILFWDESDNEIDWLTVGTGLSLSGNTITNTGLLTSGVSFLVRLDNNGATPADFVETGGFDTGNNFASNTFTVPYTGVYSFQVNLQHHTTASGREISINLRNNAGIIHTSRCSITSNGVTDIYQTCNLNVTKSLSVNDAIDITITTDSTKTTIIEDNASLSWWSGFLIPQ